ncbi:hypothetical protein DFH08DRAFT_814691 [Mycena albidolilacea]|uniref:Uncharacterized protein n=1 Tax=Mycena albidolilacea TaxID=1033008 RepID=A0AAD6ZNW0_9AGAR|nr:hypothetical protein DFH08DRAFT_814691 [Mycena albidolilacea]
MNPPLVIAARVLDYRWFILVVVPVYLHSLLLLLFVLGSPPQARNPRGIYARGAQRFHPNDLYIPIQPRTGMKGARISGNRHDEWDFKPRGTGNVEKGGISERLYGYRGKLETRDICARRTIEYTIGSAARIIRRVNTRSCSLSAVLTAKSSVESIFRSVETRKWYIMRVETTVNISDKPLACPLISTSIMLISNLTLAAAAGTVLNILNFPKENAIDLAGGGCIELTPVQIFHASFTTNQHWILSGGPSTFQIISKCGTFLTYPGAGSAIALRSQATTRANATAAWTIQLVNASAPAGPWNILETPSKAALTAWDLHPGSALLDAPFNGGDIRVDLSR